MARVDEVSGARHRAPVAARRRGHHRDGVWSVVPLLLLALLAVIVSPSGTTQARWQDSAAVDLPTLHADTLEIGVAGRTAAGFTVTNTSTRAVLEWKVSSLQIDLPEATAPDGQPDGGSQRGGRGQGWLNGTKPFTVHAGRATAGGECTGSVVARGRFRPDARLTELGDVAVSRLDPDETGTVCVEFNNPNVHRWMAESGVDVTLSVEAWSGSGGWTTAGDAVAPYRVAGAEQEWPSWFHWLWSLLRAWISDLGAAWQDFWAQYGPEIGGSEPEACADIAGAGVCPGSARVAAGTSGGAAVSGGVAVSTGDDAGTNGDAGASSDAAASSDAGASGAASADAAARGDAGTSGDAELAPIAVDGDSATATPNTEVGAAGADGTGMTGENQARATP